MTARNLPADFAVYAPDGRLVACVEARARRDASSTWAAAVRDRFLDRSPLLDTAYVLVTPVALYVWRAGVPRSQLASYEGPTEKALGDYFARVGVEATKGVDPGVFESIVSWWLNDVASGSVAHEPALEKAGVFAFLVGGRIEHEAA